MAGVESAQILQPHGLVIIGSKHLANLRSRINSGPFRGGHGPMDHQGANSCAMEIPDVMGLAMFIPVTRKVRPAPL